MGLKTTGLDETAHRVRMCRGKEACGLIYRERRKEVKREKGEGEGMKEGGEDPAECPHLGSPH